MAQAAIFVAGHQKIARARKLGMDLRHKAWDHHRVDVGPGYEQAMYDVRRGKAKRDPSIGRNGDTLRHEHELGRDRANSHRAIACHRCAEIMLGELSGEMKRLRINPLDIARRIDADRECREQDHAQGRSDEDTHAERPQQFGLENPALMHLVRGIGHAVSPPSRAG